VEFLIEFGIVGIGNNEIFRIDPRISTPSKLVDSEFKSYNSKMGFICATTTGKGELAVGNNIQITLSVNNCFNI
jgi:hypothetical protein